MSTINLEPLLEQAERRAVLTVLRAHPEWTLGCVFKHLEQNGDRAPLLRELALRELLAEPVELDPIPAEEPPIDRRRLEVAKRLRGARFDDVVRTVLTEAGSEPVAASYVKVDAFEDQHQLCRFELDFVVGESSSLGRSKRASLESLVVDAPARAIPK